MIIQILSLIIALLAVIIGPIITYRITKKNLEIKFRTMTQEKWVDKLEESTHSFLNSSLEWIEKYRGLRDRSSQLKNPNIEIDRMLNAINSSIIKLQLLLDNNKPDQKCILDNVVEMKHIINDKSFENDSISRLRVCHENIIERLKNIFHEERNKIASIFR